MEVCLYFQALFYEDRSELMDCGISLSFMIKSKGSYKRDITPFLNVLELYLFGRPTDNVYEC